jgi:glycosyltransferase involved in cell wall biosynthesis
MSDTSLAICIPTYNRAEILRATLRHLADLSGDIAEIVITDNASEDHTRDVVEESQHYFQRLFYHRHDENLGSWRNIHSALSVSRCKYQYLLSDDDRILMSGIKKGISILEEDPSSVAVCGGYKDIDENGDLRLEMISGYPNRKFEKKDKIDLFNSFFYLWHPIFLTESYQRYCFNDGLSMGFWALMDQMLNAGSIWVIPEFFYEHYATEGRLEQSITEPWYQEFHKADVEVFLGQLKPDISQLPNIAELVTRRHKHVQQFAMTAAKEKGDAPACLWLAFDSV